MLQQPKLRAVFRARITDRGELVHLERARWVGWCARHHGKNVVLLAEPERKRRSLDANAYLWGVVYGAIAEWSGHDAEELHEFFKDLFLPKRTVAMPSGESREILGSTVTDSGAFATYIDDIKKWAAERGLYIPEPGEMVEAAAQ